MKIKISICDDEAEQLKYLTNLCKRWAEKKQLEVDILTFVSSESYLFYSCVDKSTDILLLDIEMPGMNGMELAKKLRYDGDSVQLIFITGYADFIADGYDVSALHYLLKPLDEGKFDKVLSQATAHIVKKKTAVVLAAEGMVVRLYEEDIEYFEASGHGTIAYTTKGSQKLSESISGITEKLSKAFIQCHRSYLVNIKKIAYITKTEIILDGTSRIPLARGKYEIINQSFLDFHAK